MNSFIQSRREVTGAVKKPEAMESSHTAQSIIYAYGPGPFVFDNQ